MGYFKQESKIQLFSLVTVLWGFPAQFPSSKAVQDSGSREARACGVKSDKSSPLPAHRNPLLPHACWAIQLSSHTMAAFALQSSSEGLKKRTHLQRLQRYCPGCKPQLQLSS
ncbi:inhibin beta C chain [Platysternon megacephalum]|uniref:Inhibin beta C chain n=1 Tax=Platysternon megacephalum TaxID=55544 RepID=A0A4D9E0L2_9SAUR|nr:inhibin beta C chain [Platysternon megacephalum]